MSTFTVLGHRGAKGHAPENTLPSFRRGIELGATMLELDIHLSRDNQLVVMHDPVVDRTTDGGGAIRDLTLAEIKRLDAGTWYGPEFAGARVPTLQEVVDATRGKALLNVEVKATADGGGYDGICELLKDCLAENSVTDQVVISTFHPPYLKELRALNSPLQLALLYSKPIEDPCALAADEGWGALHPNLRRVDRSLIERAHGMGLLVRAWNPNEVSDMEPLIDVGVDGIGTDYPERLVALAKERGVL